MKKIILFIVIIFILSIINPYSVFANSSKDAETESEHMYSSESTPMLINVPYKSYNFDYWRDSNPMPIPYKPVGTISGEAMGAGSLITPLDMAVADNGDLYILDTGNNRIVVCDNRGKFKKVIEAFLNNGIEDTFNKPAGIDISKNGEIHIADTENRRIVSLNADGTLFQTFGLERNALTGDDFTFYPLKVGVDSAHRYYVLARNMFQGIMSFEKDGSFFGFFGTIMTVDTMADRFWKMAATEAQRAKLSLFVPMEFNNIDIDSGNFVFATNSPNMVDGIVQYENTIRRINPSDRDVLVNYNENTFINGDAYFRNSGPNSGPTSFIDIKVQEKGIFSALDSTRGRIYTYDSEGNLLYVFGGMGKQLGMFKLPTAIESHDDLIYVLDGSRAEITVFKPTKYGDMINKAIGLRFDGSEAEAVEYWREVLKLNSNYELAYSGIGKSLLAQNINKEAAGYLAQGMNKRYYSTAYKRYRNDFLRENIYHIFVGIALLFFASSVIRLYRKHRATRKAKEVSAT